MRLLLDTHIFIWFNQTDRAMPPSMERAILDGGNQVWMSVVVAWEIAIKRGIGKLSIDLPTQQTADAFGFAVLPVTLDHTAKVDALPHHHSDPFDRLLIAQAQHEGLTLVTADPKMRLYDVPVLGPA